MATYLTTNQLVIARMCATAGLDGADCIAVLQSLKPIARYDGVSLYRLDHATKAIAKQNALRLRSKRA